VHHDRALRPGHVRQTYLNPVDGSTPLRYVGRVVTRSFNRAFGRLVTAFTRYHNVPRAPHNIAELGTARWKLELARATMTIERQQVFVRPSGSLAPPRQVALSDTELARLRVLGNGLSQ